MMGKEDLGASPGAEVVLQLLREKSEKIEVLARTLSVIQQGMLRNNHGHVKDSVNEATEVLSGTLNTHKCLLESGVEIQKKLESYPASKRRGISWRPRSASLGDTPKKLVEKKEKKQIKTKRKRKSKKGFL